MMEKTIVDVAWCDRNYGGSLGSNVPGAVVFTAPTFEALQKEAKESLEFHVEGLMENVTEWLKNRDYEFEYNIIR
jgi:predicted RNase H-like HicB family nuclease